MEIHHKIQNAQYGASRIQNIVCDLPAADALKKMLPKDNLCPSSKHAIRQNRHNRKHFTHASRTI
jgi:hypothetical protein